MSRFDVLIKGTWDIDAGHSEVGFTVHHLMSKVRGQFRTFEGKLIIGDNPLDTSVVATIDMNSIDTRSEDGDNHLRASDQPPGPPAGVRRGRIRPAHHGVSIATANSLQ